MAAEWFVGPVMEKLINSCSEYLEDQFRWQTGMKKELERLRENHPKIQAVVFAAAQAQIEDRNPALNKWLWQLRDAIDEADDLLDEFEYMKHKEQVTKNNGETKLRSATTSFLFETARKFRKIGERALKIDPDLKRLEEVVQKLDKVSTEVGSFLHLLETTKQEQQLDLHKTRETGPLPRNDFIGRSKDKEFVLQWLMQPSNEEHETQITDTALYRNISLLSIVGHGGMGKTTLLQLVYEDEITKEFDLKMWVCVSNNFDAKKVIADMLECLKKKRPRLESISTLQEILKSTVQSKKFLLILDDIWDEEEERDKRKWENVLAPLAYGSLGSKILVTTRMESVATMITKVIKKKKEILILKGLEKDDCLHILNTNAFAGEKNPDVHKKLRSITYEIAKKLSGSPLAAKVIGGALNSNLDKRHWITILNSDFRSAEFVQNGILPILRLSYTFLPRSLQNCFAFCSIFPQDHKFDKDNLVRMWIALGFIQSSANQEETMEDIGGRYFDALVKKSFFDQSCFGSRYKMHDLLYELAESISAQECFKVVRDKELHSRIPETIRHLSIYIENLEILKQIGKCKRLRTLFLSIDLENEEIVDALTKIFQSLRSIRLLYINCNALRLIPEAKGNLVHLQCLMIYFRKETTPLPSSLSNLYHLLFIICNFKSKPRLNDFLPRDMNNLFNLRYLKIPWGYFDMISGIGKLRSLQELNGFSVKNEVGYSIQELEHMNELRQLRIKLLENVKDDEQVCKAKLCDKRNLIDLTLEWGIEASWSTVDFNLHERVLDNLQPHNSLNKLSIQFFMGVRSPIWLNNANLMSNLECIRLDMCLKWQTLPPFGKLPFLKSLYLHNMPKAKNIDYNYHRNEKDCVFPSLEQLEILYLDALEDWFDATITDDCFFPCLTSLVLKNCPKLKELPCLPPKLKSLRIINIGWKTLSCRSISKSIPLEEVFVEKCPNITCISLADNITRLAAFRDLTIEDCPNLISLESPSSLKILFLRIAGVSQLQLLPNFPASLVHLELSSLESLQCLSSSLSTISSLKELWIDDVPLLQQLPDLPSSLKYLRIKDCHEELRKRYDVISGFDRDKLAHIPRVDIL